LNLSRKSQIWRFFQSKNNPKEFEKAKNYKFGLKNAKLATLPRTGVPNLWYASNFDFFTKIWIHSFRVYISGFGSK